MRKWAKSAASVALLTASLGAADFVGTATANASTRTSFGHAGSGPVQEGDSEASAGGRSGFGGSEINVPYGLRVDVCDRALVMFGATDRGCTGSVQASIGVVMGGHYRTLPAPAPMRRDTRTVDSDETTTTPRLPTRPVEPGLNAYRPTEIPVDAENRRPEISIISKEKASLDPTRVAPAATISGPAQETGPGTLFGLAISALLAAAAVLMTVARRIRLGRW